MGKTSRSFSLDEDLDQRIDARSDLNPSAITNEFWREYLAAGRSPDAALVMRKERIQNQLDEVRSDLGKLKSREEQLVREREQVESLLERQDEKTRSAVEDVVGHIDRGEFPRSNVDIENPAIQNWAAEAGMTAQRLVDELEARL